MLLLFKLISLYEPQWTVNISKQKILTRKNNFCCFSPFPVSFELNWLLEGHNTRLRNRVKLWLKRKRFFFFFFKVEWDRDLVLGCRKNTPLSLFSLQDLPNQLEPNLAILSGKTNLDPINKNIYILKYKTGKWMSWKLYCNNVTYYNIK